MYTSSRKVDESGFEGFYFAKPHVWKEDSLIFYATVGCIPTTRVNCWVVVCVVNSTKINEDMCKGKKSKGLEACVLGEGWVEDLLWFWLEGDLPLHLIHAGTI